MSKFTGFGPPDANGKVWKRMQSKGGKDFEFGCKESDLKQAIETYGTESDISIPATATIQKAYAADNHGWVPVNWKVGDDKWIATDQAVEDEGISQYQLYFNGHPNVYDYTLEFTNTKGWSYHFIDDTQDCYGCDTWRDCDHYIKYNSAQPTIKFVKQGAYSGLPA
ncbi:hypothetical protein L218DRAFT_175488 [Marasmius fiardii PR-910]|nr:hypothetical protein L218DRAFT_949750 [Marasmius fiardii PR-910]KAF9256757.1 hypothetical protein L218DRAFT_175488 [Marasmius fiardii PR-910]